MDRKLHANTGAGKDDTQGLSDAFRRPCMRTLLRAQLDDLAPNKLQLLIGIEYPLVGREIILSHGHLPQRRSVCRHRFANYLTHDLYSTSNPTPQYPNTATPSPGGKIGVRCGIAQLAERLTLDQEVLSSSLSPAATLPVLREMCNMGTWR
jgi:hypothetical protein